MQDSTSSNSSTSILPVILAFSLAGNFIQYNLATTSITKLEGDLKDSQKLVTKSQTEISKLEGKLDGYKEGRR